MFEWQGRTISGSTHAGEETIEHVQSLATIASIAAVIQREGPLPADRQ